MNARGIEGELSRGFISNEISHAGGVSFSNYTRKTGQVVEDKFFVLPYSYKRGDMWYGHAFKLPFLEGKPSYDRTRLVLAGRIAAADFLERPPTTSRENRPFLDRTSYFVKIGLSERDYYRDVLVYGFGRTEDIPHGGVVSFTTGYERIETGNRGYFGWRAAHGKYYSRFGYLYGLAEFGSFFNVEEKRREQGLVNGELRYFSMLANIGSYKIRQFVNVRFTRGFNRFEGEAISISNRDGLNGISNFALRGTQRLAFNLETTVFTPINFFGFRLATFLYSDMGYVNWDNKNLLSDGLIQSHGIGFRIRNENLNYATIQVRVGIISNTPFDRNSLLLDTSPIPSLSPRDFDVKAPGSGEFR